MRAIIIVAGLCLACLACIAPPAANAQAAGSPPKTQTTTTPPVPHPRSPAALAHDTVRVLPSSIMRESFEYHRDGRRDPFVSLLTTNELRPTITDLKLTGVLFDHSGMNSVATLRDLTDNKQYRVKTGTTLGRMRVTAIKTTTVVFTIDEFGTTRQDSLVLRDPTKARPR